MHTYYKIIAAIVLFIGLSSLVFIEGDEGHFVFLHGKKQYVLVQGTGDPTVVFITGKGRPQTDFKKVYNKIKKEVQIFSYDRASTGQSQALNNERTVDTMAYELNELLLKEKIKPPFILVGHSLGTYIMRCFANMYPTRVSGLVFVEPAHEYEYQYGLTLRTDSDKIVFKDQFKSFLKVTGKTKGNHIESLKCFDFDSLGFSTNQRIVKKINIPTTIPMTVILSTVPDVENDYISKEIDYKINYFTKWQTINFQTKIIVTSKSGYFIQKEEPDLVIDAIQDMIRKVKK
jgi:pimeloyl-ACP methyl ester carboxylesterase